MATQSISEAVFDTLTHFSPFQLFIVGALVALITAGVATAASNVLWILRNKKWL